MGRPCDPESGASRFLFRSPFLLAGDQSDLHGSEGSSWKLWREGGNEEKLARSLFPFLRDEQWLQIDLMSAIWN
jgi:hypothetical protein